MKQTKTTSAGCFGEFGGAYVSDSLKRELDNVYAEYLRLKKDKDFRAELAVLRHTYQGRPTPLYYCRKLSEQTGGADIYLKREDLNHTGAHKINHCIGEVLLAKHLGKKTVIGETGAGQHGLALATACALLGLNCRIFMGETDVKKQAINVRKMQLLGAEVVCVSSGGKTLKDAVDRTLIPPSCATFNRWWAGRHARSSSASKAACPTRSWLAWGAAPMPPEFSVRFFRINR